MNNKFKIFISSNQNEFKKERKKIKDIITADPLYNDFFDVFLFEDIHASGKSPEKVYIDGINNSEIYICLIGDEYGTIQKNGLSATENEYDGIV